MPLAKVCTHSPSWQLLRDTNTEWGWREGESCWGGGGGWGWGGSWLQDGWIKIDVIRHAVCCSQTPHTVWLLLFLALAVDLKETCAARSVRSGVFQFLASWSGCYLESGTDRLNNILLLLLLLLLWLLSLWLLLLLLLLLLFLYFFFIGFFYFWFFSSSSSYYYHS